MLPINVYLYITTNRIQHSLVYKINLSIVMCICSPRIVIARMPPSYSLISYRINYAH